jgi:5-methyltetrahydrofolate--homocysteine methyltransferase
VTTISSATRTVSFGGPGEPTALIGERINPTGKAKLAAALQAGDYSLVASAAKRQAAAGAHVLDVNVGAPGVDEPAAMARSVEMVMSVGDLPICVDSSNPAAIAAGLKAYRGKALINSVTGERHSLDAILPLVKTFGAAIIGMTQDDGGIPSTAEERLAIARRILDECDKLGIPREDVVIDCACLSAGADPMAPLVTLQTVRLVTEQLGVSTVLGASNVSFGLPGRKAINAGFLAMAIGAGLASAIVDPTVPEVVNSIHIADLLAGRDDYATRYLAYYRATQAAEQKPT